MIWGKNFYSSLENLVSNTRWNIQVLRLLKEKCVYRGTMLCNCAEVSELWLFRIVTILHCHKIRIITCGIFFLSYKIDFLSWVSYSEDGETVYCVRISVEAYWLFPVWLLWFILHIKIRYCSLNSSTWYGGHDTEVLLLKFLNLTDVYKACYYSTIQL